MRVYIFTDLDDTLFQTLRKCDVPPDCTPDIATSYGLAPAALSLNGEPMSFMTQQQQYLLGLFADASIIPVTARNLDAFNRVRLPFPHGAVLNYGGTVLLPDGNEDLSWKAHIMSCLEPFQRFLHEGIARLTAAAESMRLPVRMRIIGTNDCGFYVVVKNVAPTNCFLGKIRREGETIFNAGAGWCVHQNDNNLAFIPAVLNKAYAVKHIIDQRIRPLGNDFLTIGMGDSLVDLRFMNECHYSIVPSTSQIQKVRLHE